MWPKTAARAAHGFHHVPGTPGGRAGSGRSAVGQDPDGGRATALAGGGGWSVDAENLGALVRNCAGFNAHALVVGETGPSPFLRRAVRSSMGAIFELPVVESRSLAESLSQMRHTGSGVLRRIRTPPRAGWQQPI